VGQGISGKGYLDLEVEGRDRAHSVYSS